ncbi:unnamed protein product [Hermetia illucens]|uniref:Uncharacterized protein n=1 Tax=Hermetia illucens TaxID=343691 RepID=A0A7R8UVG2_HERIL|nr:unnamed protein product [Hermetia illucens]
MPCRKVPGKFRLNSQNPPVFLDIVDAKDYASIKTTQLPIPLSQPFSGAMKILASRVQEIDGASNLPLHSTQKIRI